MSCSRLFVPAKPLSAAVPGNHITTGGIKQCFQYWFEREGPLADLVPPWQFLHGCQFSELGKEGLYVSSMRGLAYAVCWAIVDPEWFPKFEVELNTGNNLSDQISYVWFCMMMMIIKVLLHADWRTAGGKRQLLTSGLWLAWMPKTWSKFKNCMGNKYDTPQAHICYGNREVFTTSLVPVCILFYPIN